MLTIKTSYICPNVDIYQKFEDLLNSRKNILRSVQKAFLSAMLSLPREEYDWFEMPEKSISRTLSSEDTENYALSVEEAGNGKRKQAEQKEFFEIAGPLFSARIQPGSAILPINATKTFRVCRILGGGKMRQTL